MTETAPIPLPPKPETGSELEGLRGEIDQIDNTVIQVLARRMQVSKDIKKIKQETGLATFDPAREEKLKARVSEMAGQNGLSEEFCLQLYELILAESKRVQDSLQ
jgi:chorismate mutase